MNDINCLFRSEVMNLLESAGFSRANPYYIVKQGNPTSHLSNVRIGTTQVTVS